MVTVSSVVCVQFVCREGHGDFVSSVVCSLCVQEVTVTLCRVLCAVYVSRRSR